MEGIVAASEPCALEPNQQIQGIPMHSSFVPRGSLLF
jgi:hypothetical protein